jgi:hypothetical protein
VIWSEITKKKSFLTEKRQNLAFSIRNTCTKSQSSNCRNLAHHAPILLKERHKILFVVSLGKGYLPALGTIASPWAIIANRAESNYYGSRETGPFYGIPLRSSQNVLDTTRD